ncbi:MAG: tetratricopeptide repeat protein, partial [Bacteroidota bacterium]
MRYKNMSNQKFTLFLLFGLLYQVCVYAQSDKVDAESHKVELGAKDIEEKVDIYNDLAWHFRNLDPEMAESYIDTVITLSNKIDYTEGIATAYRSKGYISIHTGDNEAGLRWYAMAKDLFEQSKNAEKLSELLTDIGVVHRKMGNYTLAHDSYAAALEIAEREQSLALLSRIYSNIGYLLKTEANYGEALEYLLESLEYAQELDDLKAIASRLNNIGEIYDIHIEDYERSMKYYREALEIREQTQDLRGVCISLRNIGALERRRAKYDEAMRYLQRALTLADSIQYSTLIASSKFQIAHVLKEQDRIQEALKYVEESIEIHKLAGNKVGYIWGIVLLGEINYVLGDYEASKRNCLEAYQIADERDMLEPKAVAARLLAKYYAARDSFEQAYRYNLTYQDINEQLTDKIKIARTATVEETRRYEAEKLAEKERQKQ